MADANIRAVITAQDEASGVIKNFGASANTQLNAVHDTANKTRTGFENMFKAVVFGNVIFSLATDAARLFKEGLGEANNVANEMQASMAQINQLLITTHGASGQTAESLNKMAESIAKTTPISKEAALAGEQMLLPFTNIHQEVFPGVMKAADDLATHLNHGLAPNTDQVASAAKQLGRAFNDPANGMGLLRRAGVSLTHDQQEQIKAMQEQGNLLGAQKLLLQDLGNTMGGSATASAKTFNGQLTMLKNSLIDVAANEINKLKPILEKDLPIALNYFNTVLLPTFKNIWDTTWPIIKTTFTVIADLVKFISDHMWIFWGLVDVFIAIKIQAMLSGVAEAFSGVMSVVRGEYSLTAALINAPMTMTILVAGALFAIQQVYNKGQETLKLLDKLNSQTLNENQADTKAMQDVANAYHSGKISKAAYQKFFEGLANQRASGGPITPGIPYLVGELGPELVVPKQNATVIPNNKLANAMGQSINITVQAGAFMGSPQDARQYAKLILSSLQDVASSKGFSLDQLWDHRAVRSI